MSICMSGSPIACRCKEETHGHLSLWHRLHKVALSTCHSLLKQLWNGSNLLEPMGQVEEETFIG